MEKTLARPTGCNGNVARCVNLYGTHLIPGFQGRVLDVSSLQEGHRMMDCALLKPGEVCPIAQAMLGATATLTPTATK